MALCEGASGEGQAERRVVCFMLPMQPGNDAIVEISSDDSQESSIYWVRGSEPALVSRRGEGVDDRREAAHEVIVEESKGPPPLQVQEIVPEVGMNYLLLYAGQESVVEDLER